MSPDIHLYLFIVAEIALHQFVVPLELLKLRPQLALCAPPRAAVTSATMHGRTYDACGINRPFETMHD